SGVWINEPVVPRGTHAVDRMLSLLDALDVPPEPAGFGPEKLFRGDTPEPVLARLAEAPGPFALLHPGAGWANKIYPPAWWGEAVRRLRAVTGVPTWVAAAPNEERLAREVEAAAGGAARVVPAGDL